MKKETKSNGFLDILGICCVISTFSLLLLNVLSWLADENKLLKLWANVFFFFISFIISIIIYCGKKEKSFFNTKFKTLLRNISSLFIIVFFLLNTLVYMIENGVMWKLNSILLIALFSIVICLLKRFLTIKSYLLSSLLYLLVVGIFFFLLTVTIGGFGEGNKMLILLFAYVAAYTLCAIIVYLVKRSLEKEDNLSQAYTKQF